MNLVEPEIVASVPEWLDLKKINGSFVAVHSLLVTWRIVQDPLYKKYSKQDQNILKWAGLLHDIEKLGPPVYNGKDHIHPFKGAVTVLKIF